MKHSYTLPRRLSRSLMLGAASLLFQLMPSADVKAQTPNIDFNAGNFSNWTCWVGMATTGTPSTGTYFDSGVISSPIGGLPPNPNNVGRSRHYITSGSDTDFYGGFPVVAPSGGTYSLRLGTDSPLYRSDRVQYMIHVPAATASFNLQCQYAIVLEDPQHQAEEQPTFQLVAYDSATGTVLPAANNLYIAHYAFPGFTLSNANPTGIQDVYYLPWTTTTINLSGMGGKTVVLECTALDCSLGGHFGYGYFDVTAVQDSLVASLLRYNNVGDSATLKGPPGYKYYQWFDQNFHALNGPNDSAMVKTLPTPSTAQRYNLVIVPWSSTGVADTIQSPVLKPYGLGVSSSSIPKTAVVQSPSGETLHVSFADPFDGTISLISAAGQVVYNARLSKSTSYEIPTNGMPAGIYGLVLKNDKGESSQQKIFIRK